MKKMLLALAVVLMTLASCTPSAIEIKPGSAAEAAQKFFDALKNKDFDTAASLTDLDGAPASLMASALKASFGETNFTEIFVTEEGEEVDGVVPVKLYGSMDGDTGYIPCKVKKASDGSWVVDFESIGQE